MRRILFSTLALGIGLAYPAPPAGAQDLREYRFELGVAGTYTSYDDATDLGGAAGGLLRVGYWLPYNFSIEAEGGLARPRTESADVSVSVRSLWGAVLYNLPIGALSRLHFKAGYGVVTYGEGSCPAVSLPGSGPCGSAATAVGGIGARIGVTPTLFIRSEATVTRTLSIRFSNVNFNLGVSLMLGSRTIGDADRDGVDDRADACPATPAGVLTDRRGCPSDSDGDRVADGLDRCPGTAPGAPVDEVGCAPDADADGVPDAADKCQGTPAGAVADETGCPADGDADRVLDGLDRCPDTPVGATVDQLGCPEDRDNDGVYEGIDRCPDTPPGAPVGRNGCPAEAGGPDGDADGIPDPSDRCPSTSPGVRVDARGCPTLGEAPAAPDTTAPPAAPATGWPRIVPGTAFAQGSARLQVEMYPALDSIVAALRADTTFMVEIIGHAHDTRDEEQNERLSRLRAEAVRNYFIEKGVAFQRLVARGMGSKVPLTTDPGPDGQAANRRVEVQPVPEAP